jgi:DNA-binding NtrC family response regulator
MPTLREDLTASQQNVRLPESHPAAGLVRVLSAAPVPEVFRFSSALHYVGREPPPGGLKLPLPSVSKVHVKLSFEGSRWHVLDLGSHNGTFVNGARVDRVALRDLDLIRTGDAVYVFHERGLEEYLEPRGFDELKQIGLVGGPRMSCLASDVARAAGARLPLLLLGETGTGKEGLSRGLHTLSRRRGAFQSVNCAAVPESLFESELFGHLKGAFTGAHRDAPGLFRSAHEGTLLLDEVGEMPLAAQAKVLRAIETREIIPVGGTKAFQVDVQLVAATNRDLRAMVSEGDFRADLFARLSGLTLKIPPLRERREDIDRLALHFAGEAGQSGEPTFGFRYAMVLYDWPFNVRELASAVAQAVLTAGGQPLDFPHLPEPIRESYERGKEPGAPEETSGEPRSRKRKPRPTLAELEALLQRYEGNMMEVARSLGRDRALVYRWVRESGLDPDKFRKGE